jgi:hypothetical protein
LVTRKRLGLAVGAVLIAAFLVAVVPAIGSPTGKSGSAITKVKVLRETVAQTTSSTSYVDLPGSTTTISVPSGHHALILARFSAESNCTDGSAPDFCTVRIRIGGASAAPASEIDFAFDSVDDPSNCTNALLGTNCGWESHSMDRSRGPLGPGTYTVKVQWAVTDAAAVFRLDDWSLTIESVNVG